MPRLNAGYEHYVVCCPIPPFLTLLSTARWPDCTTFLVLKLPTILGVLDPPKQLGPHLVTTLVHKLFDHCYWTWLTSELEIKTHELSLNWSFLRFSKNNAMCDPSKWILSNVKLLRSSQQRKPKNPNAINVAS